MRRKSLIYAGATAACLVLMAGALVLCNQWLTGYVESDRFRAKLEEEAAKGLHFRSGHYASIRRTGFTTVEGERFQAAQGQKVLKTLESPGTYLGLLLRELGAWLKSAFGG